ncbi:MAG: efflux RND transporter periplasmic adaptor subunit [Burkholderiales bacterium]|nr:efflux RND transporter periplasmic adaptor subunit [Burkholderiales bacterium]
MSRKLAVALLVILVIGAGLFALRGRGKDAETVTARTAPLVQTVVVTGRVASETRVVLGATVTGRVRAVRHREGAALAAGELLVQLEDTEQAAAVRQADAQLRTAAARLDSQRRLAGPVAGRQLEQARANAAAAARELQRSEALFKQGFIGAARLDEVRRASEVAASQQQAAQAQADANLEGAELAQAVTRVAEARAALELARSRLSQTRIVAPADGVLLTRLAEPGQIVQPGTRLAEISVNGPVQLVAQVDEKFLARLAPGQAASVAADAFPGRTIGARVRSIAPVVDAQRGSVEVKFALDTPPDWVRNDMTVSIEIETARRERAIAVPAEALRPGPRLLLIEDGRTVARAVRTGIRTLTAVEIVEGLSDGAQVVTDPALAEGVRVRAIPRRARAIGSQGSGAEGVTRAMSN